MKTDEIIEKRDKESSHRHWCDAEGHPYQCWDYCICICGLPMNDSDHSDCPVELRPCPEHKTEQEPHTADAMSCERKAEAEPLCEEQDAAAPPHCECGCSDPDTGKVVGWCLRCDHVYANYTPEIEARHFANHCPAAPASVKEAARARLTKLRM